MKCNRIPHPQAYPPTHITNMDWFNPVWSSKYIHYGLCDDIYFPLPNFKDTIVEVWEDWVISSHILLGIDFFIYVGIQVIPC